MWHDAFICATWLIQMADITRSCVWHDSIICVTWLLHICEREREKEIERERERESEREGLPFASCSAPKNLNICVCIRVHTTRLKPKSTPDVFHPSILSRYIYSSFRVLQLCWLNQPPFKRCSRSLSNRRNLDITIHQLISGNCILAVNASTTLLVCAFCDVTSKKAHD